MFRDTDSPQTIVQLNGAARELGILSSVRVQQRLSTPDLCELHYRYPQIAEDENLVGFRLRLDVELDGTINTLFDGEITSFEYIYLPYGSEADASNLEFVIRAHDLLHRLGQHQSVRSFENISFVQLAREVCRQHGIEKVRVWESPISAGWPLLIQHQQTDLEFLVEMAAQQGLYLTLSGEELEAFRLAGRPENPVKFDRHQLIEARLERHANSPAQAELEQRKSSEITLWARVPGTTNLRPGTLVELEGVAKLVAARYVLTAVDHTIAEDGFFSEISSALPEPTRWPRADVSTIGVVTRTDDPERLGRVRVELSAYNGVQTDWIPQVSPSPSAGEQKGLVRLPDVGELVLVLITRENPAQFIVLGRLYGQEQTSKS